ncbi:hypothetical protein ELQ87_07470 [Streptomyces griseoviridis]|uniref:Uncharacterized protein n=1 Tax=Streptomyces griseoviridis TaxID=45398 RepID=A0A3Q9KU46_STRGD|nr:hypothetical protein ELQ87_07470 [Streptomyces griseoviridis]
MTPHLNERQLRLQYRAEARILGHGGIAAVAKAGGVSKDCVSRGLHRLLIRRSTEKKQLAGSRIDYEYGYFLVHALRPPRCRR